MHFMWKPEIQKIFFSGNVLKVLMQGSVSQIFYLCHSFTFIKYRKSFLENLPKYVPKISFVFIKNWVKYVYGKK